MTVKENIDFKKAFSIDPASHYEICFYDTRLLEMKRSGRIRIWIYIFRSSHFLLPTFLQKVHVAETELEIELGK